MIYMLSMYAQCYDAILYCMGTINMGIVDMGTIDMGTIDIRRYQYEELG